MTEYSERFVLAIDQGTTSTRCIIFDRHGRLVAVRQREHEQHFPRPGWVEHDAVEIWSNVTRIVPAALREAGIGLEKVAALGVANQRETTVLWDRHTGVPIGRAIVWQDTRTSALLDRMAGHPDVARVEELCGLPLSHLFLRAAAALALRPRRRPARTRGHAVTCCSGRWRPGSSGI